MLYVQGRSCNISKPTIRYVTSCPKDELSWKEAAKRKNCNTLANVAVNMGCVKNASDFVYHCVINHWLNATLEVCAATRYIQGIFSCKILHVWNVDFYLMSPWIRNKRRIRVFHVCFILGCLLNIHVYGTSYLNLHGNYASIHILSICLQHLFLFYSVLQ